MAAKKDNTLLFVGLGVLAFVFLNNNSSETVAPKTPMQKLAEDIANGDVILQIEDVPNPDIAFDAPMLTCLQFRDLGISRLMYGDSCDRFFDMK